MSDKAICKALSEQIAFVSTDGVSSYSEGETVVGCEALSEQVAFVSTDGVSSYSEGETKVRCEAQREPKRLPRP